MRNRKLYFDGNERERESESERKKDKKRMEDKSIFQTFSLGILNDS